MRILLVNPPEVEKIYSRYEEAAPLLPPLGICYIAGVLLENGHEVHIVDCVAEALSLEDLDGRIKQFKPDVLGLTATTVMFNSAKRVAENVKKKYPSVITVLGGAHVSALPEATLTDYPFFDFGVIGEGELTMTSLIERLASKRGVEDVAGVIFREKGGRVKWVRRAPIKDLDSLPFPSRHLLKDMRLYRPPITRTGGTVPTSMITSRGCPIGCAFCDQAVFGRNWRAHSAGYIMREIQHVHAKYNVDFITFEDDLFLGSKQRVAELCDRLNNQEFDLGWGCSVRADSVNDAILAKMKRAGCTYMFVGVESGSEKILAMVDKKQSLKKIESGIKLIKKHGIRVVGSAVIGFPSETKTDIRQTVKFVLSLPLDGLSFFIFTPFPNTPLYKYACQKGNLSPDWQKYSSHPSKLAYVPTGLTEKYLLKTQKMTYLRFFMRPHFVWEHFADLFKWGFIKRSLRTVLKMIFSKKR